MEKIDVGKVYLVKDTEKEEFLGVDVEFNESSITSRQSAVFVLDFLRTCMNSAGWTTKTIMMVKESTDAQNDRQGNSEDNKTSAAN